jgi:hypothetical protein
MDEIVKNGPKMNQEWVVNHPDHYLSKWFGCKGYDVETSCEITARALLEQLGINYDFLIPQDNLPRFLSPGIRGLEIMEEMKNNPLVLITIGEAFDDIDHFMVLHKYYLIDSWFRRYTIRARPLDETVVFAFRLGDIASIIGDVIPKKDCKDMKIWYWML